MNFLVTGGAGFIGSHLGERLLAQGHHVLCLDNFDEFYDPALKRRNLRHALEDPKFRLMEGDLREESILEKIFGGGKNRYRGPPRGPGRSSSFHPEPALICGSEYPRYPQPSGGLQETSCRAIGLCLLLFGLREQPQNSLCRKRSGGQSHFSLRRHQESGRASSAIPTTISTGSTLPACVTLRSTGPDSVRRWRSISLPD